MRCPQCDHDVPALDFCVRCGFPLGVDAHDVPRRRSSRARFAAAPNEHAWAPHVVSTLFPQLARADMAYFSVATVLGLGVVAALAFARLFPAALTAACVLVPLLVVLYLFAVDIYEDEPLRVVAFSAAAGAVVGVVLGLLLQHVDGVVRTPGLEAFRDSGVVWRVIVFPLVGGVGALAGPLVLLRYRRFNDVLDGATFGATAAVALAGAQTLVQAWPLTAGGVRPAGEVVPWLVRLFEIAMLVPLVWAGAIGTAAAALWLRYRAPVRDRRALGPLGSPVVALVVAALLIVAAPAGLHALDRNVAFVWLLALAAVAVLLLRRAIHLGLVEEADEIEIGPEIVCGNCRRLTPRHTFCGRCGIALRALPKAKSSGTGEVTDVGATS